MTERNLALNINKSRKTCVPGLIPVKRIKKLAVVKNEDGVGRADYGAVR